MKVDELLKRARSALGKKVKYRLGAGGIDPNSPTPASVDNACDCSGFVCWCLGISRKTDHPLYVRFNGGWINTDAIVHDANQPTGFFRKIDEPKVGCLVVFPSKKPRRPYGHVGIVTEVREGKVTKVIHCSSGNFRRYGRCHQRNTANSLSSPRRHLRLV
jgi:cell wall-associated NlpC family hydrolase